MIESVKKELGKIADNELNDDFLEEVSGGRELNRNESAGLIIIYQEIARTYVEKNMSRELFISTLDVLDNYEKYIRSILNSCLSIGFS